MKHWCNGCVLADTCALPQDVLEWKTSRKFFYWRLRRRLCEQQTLKVIMDADLTLSRGEAMELLRRWFVESKGTVNVSLWGRVGVATCSKGAGQGVE